MVRLFAVFLSFLLLSACSDNSASGSLEEKLKLVARIFSISYSGTCNSHDSRTINNPECEYAFDGKKLTITSKRKHNKIVLYEEEYCKIVSNFYSAPDEKYILGTIVTIDFNNMYFDEREIWTARNEKVRGITLPGNKAAFKVAFTYSNNIEIDDKLELTGLSPSSAEVLNKRLQKLNEEYCKGI